MDRISNSYRLIANFAIIIVHERSGNAGKYIDMNEQMQYKCDPNVTKNISAIREAFHRRAFHCFKQTFVCTKWLSSSVHVYEPETLEPWVYFYSVCWLCYMLASSHSFWTWTGRRLENLEATLCIGAVRVKYVAVCRMNVRNHCDCDAYWNLKRSANLIWLSGTFHSDVLSRCHSVVFLHIERNYYIATLLPG